MSTAAPPKVVLFAVLLSTASMALGWQYRPQADVAGRTVAIQANVTYVRPNTQPVELSAIEGVFNIPDTCGSGERIMVRPRLDRVYSSLEVACEEGKFKLGKVLVRREIAADRR